MADKISITICGDGGCGKSSITLRLVRSQWTHEYDPTIEDSYSVTRTIDGHSYHLSLTDTAGQEEYRSLWASSNLSSDAFLLVYDLTNPSSLDTLTHYIDMIDIETEQRLEENSHILKSGASVSLEEQRERIKAMPVKIVAGNKCDLKAERKISAKEGLEWARGRGCGFMETSARAMVNIEETFAVIVRRVIEARHQALINPLDPNGPSYHNNGSSNNNSNHTSNNITRSSSRNNHNNSNLTSKSQTPALPPPTKPSLEEGEEEDGGLREKEGRMDGRDGRRKTTATGTSMCWFGWVWGWCRGLRCWGAREKGER